MPEVCINYEGREYNIVVRDQGVSVEDGIDLPRLYTWEQLFLIHTVIEGMSDSEIKFFMNRTRIDRLRKMTR